MVKPKHVEVRVRHADDAESKGVFTYWPIKDLDALIEQVSQWRGPDGETAVGQFNSVGSTWFFEVVFVDD